MVAFFTPRDEEFPFVLCQFYCDQWRLSSYRPIKLVLMGIRLLNLCLTEQSGFSFTNTCGVDAHSLQAWEETPPSVLLNLHATLCYNILREDNHYCQTETDHDA